MWRWTACCLALSLAGCSSADGADDGLDGHDPVEREDDHGAFAVGGIAIDRVTIDQGVSVEVVTDGLPADPQTYQTKLVSGRNAYVRALWTVPESWQPRSIEARLGIHHPGGEVEYASKTLEIDSDSNENWLEGAFSWYVPGEWLEEGVAIDVRLYEVDTPMAAAGAPSGGSRVPLSGSMEVAIDEAPRELDVLVVRIEHAYDGGKECGGAPEIDEAMRMDLEQRLLAINPVERVHVDVRDEVMVFDQPANAFAVILDELSALREKDGAPPYLYYYGLIDLCDWGSDQGFSGQARVPDEITPEYAWKRVAVGTVRVSYGGVISTFVHEIGHTQGRYHVPCDGEKATEDDYPYRGGATASVGFDTVKWVLHPATHRDYMSYCSPDWVGDYGWNRVLPTIEKLTQWKLEGVSWDEHSRSLVGSIYPDGSERWWVVRGRVPVPADAASALRFVGVDAHATTVPARVRPHALGDGLEVVVPLPRPLDELARIERVGLPGPDRLDVGAVLAPSARRR